ncbi:unnamed protein product [Durusdinium trenchii]|uniref:Uncharacterized protein n=2 Tax=Durusdinium trenchii TaxID=1381693 RepID=A0ABP0HFE0_9DINO
MEAAAYSLSEVLKALHSKCMTLHACENRLGDQGSEQVALALAENCFVRTLRLHDNDIGDHGAAVLAEALLSNRCLLTLSMTRNRVGPAGAWELGICLRANSRLTKLDLGQNSLEDEGAINLSLGLAQNHGLLSLDLQANRIGNPGAAALAGALTKGISLRELHLRDNRIDDDGAESLAGALALSKLVLLDLSFNMLGGSGLHQLTEAVEQSETMTSLSLQGGRFQGLEVQRLQSALERNKRTLILMVDVVRAFETLQVSCRTMSGNTMLEVQIPDVTSLEELYIMVADAVGTPASLLNLIDPRGEILADSPDLVSEQFAQQAEAS